AAPPRRRGKRRGPGRPGGRPPGPAGNSSTTDSWGKLLRADVENAFSVGPRCGGGGARAAANWGTLGGREGPLPLDGGGAAAVRFGPPRPRAAGERGWG